MSLNSPLGATQSGTIELRGRAGERPRSAERPRSPAERPRSAAERPRSPAERPRSAAERPRSRSRAGQVALGGLLVTVVITVVCAAQTNLLLPESVRPVPGWLAGVFGTAGPHLGTIPLLLVLGAMFIAYAVSARHAGRLSARTIIATIAVMHALVLLAPPMLSTDVFSYQSYGRMLSVYGANPYILGPHAFALDPVYPFIGAKWINMPTAYGPVFTALSALFAPLSLTAAVLAYKALAVLASLVIVALVWDIARLRRLDPVKAIALVGLNPLIVVYGVGGAHNDLLMLAVMMVGLRFVLAHRDRAGGATMAVAAGIKLTGGVLAPFALADLADRLQGRRWRQFMLGGAVATACIAALAFGLFGTGSLHLLSTLSASQSEGDWHSIPGFISTRLGLGAIGHVTGYVLGVAFLCVFAWLLCRVWRRELDWIDAAAWTAAALLASASSLLPWYVAWLMPLAALGRDRRLVKVAVFVTGLVMFIQLVGYVPNGGSLGL